MNNFLRLFKVLYKNQNSVQKDMGNKKRKLSRTATMLLGMLPLVALVCVMFGFLGTTLKSVDEVSSMLSALLTAVQAMVLFMMLSTVMSTLYSAEDNSFLASLPMRPIAVFFAKFSLVYISALKMCALFLFPMLLTLTISFAASGHYLFYGFYPLSILVVAVAPLLPLFLVTVFTLPLMWLSSFFKGKAILKTILSLLFYVALMAGYMLVVFSFNTGGFFAEGLSESAIAALDSLSNIMYPNKVLLLFCLGIDAGKNFGISFAITVGLIAFILLLSALFYKRVTSKQLETRKEESKRAVSYKQKSVVRALMAKDFKSVIRNTGMAINSFGNIIIAPVILVAVYFISVKNSGIGVGGDGGLFGELTALGFVMMYSLIFFCGTNTLSMMAFTRDGQAFFITKQLPISAKQAVAAKLYMSIIPTAICVVIVMLLSVFMLQISVVSTLLFGVFIVIFGIGSNALNIYIDMKRGNVNWKTPADMRSNSGFNVDSLVSVMLAVIPGVSFLVMGMFFGALETSVGAIGVMAIYWSIALALAVVMAVAGLYILKVKGLPLYDKIGENNKFQPRSKRTTFGRNNDGMLG